MARTHVTYTVSRYRNVYGRTVFVCTYTSQHGVAVRLTPAPPFDDEPANAGYAHAICTLRLHMLSHAKYDGTSNVIHSRV